MGAPRDSTALLWPRGDQAFKTRPPARGACRAKEARPRQEELAGTTEPIQDHSRTKYTRQKIETPARGACREGRTQAPQEKPAAAPHAPRQGLMAGKLSGAGRRPPRQAPCRGKSPPQDCAPAHPPTRRSGVSPKGTWRGAAQPGVCGGMQPPPWRTVAHLTVRLGAVQATATGI